LNEETSGRRKLFIVSFSDDGAGIDINRLKNIIIEKKYADKEETEKMSDQQIFEYIFKDGISSKKNITHVSGRGIGMYAVKEMIDNFGGKISIKSEKDKGSTFTVTVPLRVL